MHQARNLKGSRAQLSGATGRHQRQLHNDPSAQNASYTRRNGRFLKADAPIGRGAVHWSGVSCVGECDLVRSIETMSA